MIVLGLGDTGLSMTRWLKRQGAQVTVADTRAAAPQAATLAAEWPDVTIESGDFRDDTLRGADLIAISPGVDRRAAAIAAAIQHGVPVVGDVELFAQALASHLSARALGSAPKVLGITGTNGKSTVTRMTGDICAAAGLDTVVAGNIGTPVLDVWTEIEADRPLPDVFVLELSSFQLESTDSLAADAAAVLNVSEDHLDRYSSLSEYAAAKARIFQGHGTQVLNRDDICSNALGQSGRVLHRFGLDAPRGEREWGISQNSGRAWLARNSERWLAVDELPVAGRHNAANALAAAALAHAIGIDDAVIAQGLRHFRGLPHRLARVAEINGIVFFDDSKGTNVGATIAALSGFLQPVVLIAGGDGKGQDFTALQSSVMRHARAVVLIGRDRELIATALAGCGIPLLRADNMADAVATAFAASRPGDAVVLSPACASLDMFRNYAHRGEVFAAAVQALEAAHG